MGIIEAREELLTLKYVEGVVIKSKSVGVNTHFVKLQVNMDVPVSMERLIWIAKIVERHTHAAFIVDVRQYGPSLVFSCHVNLARKGRCEGKRPDGSFDTLPR